jgi:NADH-quinone oxidoreductase subunit G
LLPYVWSPGWNSNQSLHKFQAEVGGALRGGTAGARLIDGGAGAAPAPAAAEHRGGDGFELLPRPRIFGSDELSARSPGVADLVPRAYLQLNPADAAELGVAAGDGIDVDGVEGSFEVLIDDALRRGCAAFAPGIEGCLALTARARVALRRAEHWQPSPAVIASDGATRD